MMGFVTFVGTLIHIYASGYMHGDPRYARFFAYLNMFLAFMLILVSGNNLLMLFVGWEGVGLCSYLLVGFWFDKKHGVGLKNSNAARKAFVANRIGDFGMLMAIFLAFWTFGTLDLYKPTEVTNPHMMEALASGGGHGEEGAVPANGAAEEGGHGEGSSGGRRGRGRSQWIGCAAGVARFRSPNRSGRRSWRSGRRGSWRECERRPRGAGYRIHRQHASDLQPTGHLRAGGKARPVG
ncbi:MAG: hypothetical protein HND48_04985 [Chloroflexi bacterium]|nr:hypothetical protein [Chloroflexota bacterium]